MKAIHPKWYENAKVECACGNKFVTGATVPEIRIEVCSNCHPFYTGQMKYLDAAGRVDAFKTRKAKAKKKVLTKTEKRRLKREKKIKSELDRPESLEELRKKVRKPSKKKAKKKTKKSS